MSGALPLPSLLSAALVAFTVELDNEFEHRMPHRTADQKARGETLRGPWLVSVAMWANCLRYVTEDGVTVAEVERRARTHANLDGMRRWGYVTLDGAGRRGAVGRSGPDSVLQLTAAGRRANEVWAPLVELPLRALLSRGLLVFALGYERGVKLSLALMLDVLLVLDGDGVRVADLPRLSGVSKEAIAMGLERLEKAMCVETWSHDRRRMVRLTDRGLNARRGGLRRVRDHEAAWRERFGDEAIDELRGALEPLVGDAARQRSPLFAGLEPYPDGWRAEVRAPDTLPWFPMVLHRGGWPDGS